LWSNMYLKSFNHSGVVPCFHISIHCPFSASKPQFNCRTITNRGCYRHYLFNHGLGSFCEPRKATLYLLWTFITDCTFIFVISRIERTWNCSIFFPRSQFGLRNSGTNELAINWYSFAFKFIIYFSFKYLKLTIIFFSFSVQATMPSTFKHPARVPMWKGAKVAYFFIAMCLFPMAIGGFWAYGNQVSKIKSNCLSICYKLFS
jgi:hypothetical protein